MATINASTTHSVKRPKAPIGKTSKAGTAAKARRGSIAPPLKPNHLANPTNISNLQQASPAERKEIIKGYYRSAVGAPGSARDLSKPHAASTSRDRGMAAADVALATKHTSAPFVLKECGLLGELQRTLFPEGSIDAFLNRNKETTSTLKASTSALSLASLENESLGTTGHSIAPNSVASDSKRGKTMPAAAREGCLLILRALSQIVGKPVEPYISGGFLMAALDECASTNSNVREAAEDTKTALIQLSHPWLFSKVTAVALLESLNTTEWRIKSAALEGLSQCANLFPKHVQKIIPTLIPAVTNQVWDTKAQVSKASKQALLAICETNANPDVKPAIPAVVNAICKPADTTKAVTSLMGTTFVTPVDASTLAILCPVLARALKEKLAIHKRAACLVISNMSKLVDEPSSVAPFGFLLVPELQKVAENVQFEEIRDESLKALQNLTKALGDQYRAEAEGEGPSTEQVVAELEEEQSRVEAEQARIQEERAEAARKEQELKEKEEEEKRRFKEGMDAQRRLENLAAEEAAAKKAEEKQKKEVQKLSTKGASGKCQGCGLKKCKKSCMFYNAKK